MDEEFSKDEAVVIALPEAASIYDAGWRSYVFWMEMTMIMPIGVLEKIKSNIV